MSFQSTIRFDEKKTETISVVYTFLLFNYVFIFISSNKDCKKKENLNELSSGYWKEYRSCDTDKAKKKFRMNKKSFFFLKL